MRFRRQIALAATGSIPGASLLAKTWKVYERMSLKFAWDVFNITNSVRFDTNSIDNGSDDGGFGLYSGTLTNPRVQQFSLRLTF